MVKRRPLGNTLRFEILKRDNFRCVYCGATSTEAKLQVDHIVPVAKGGSDSPENLVAACFSCNIGKRDKLLEESYLELPTYSERDLAINPVVLPNAVLNNMYKHTRKSEIIVLGTMYKALMDRAVEADFSMDDPREFRRLVETYLNDYYKSPSRVTKRAEVIRNECDMKYWVARVVSLLSEGYTLIDSEVFFDNRLSRESLILLIKLSEMRGFGRINLSIDGWKRLMGAGMNDPSSKFIDRHILKPLSLLEDIVPNLTVREVQRIRRRGSRKLTSMNLTYSYPAVSWAWDVRKVSTIINRFKEEN